MAAADDLRIATYNTELSRKGPGLLLRDILRGDDPEVSAVLAALTEVSPDVIALQGIDHDLERRTLHAFADALEAAGGIRYPYRFSLPGNAGIASGLDLNGDGQLGGPEDAQGYGRFYGQGAMAILSRFPIVETEVQDYSPLLWRDLPGALLPEKDGAPFPSAAAHQIQRLSSRGHWVVPVEVPELGRLHLLTFHATPPVFDGPEDRNGRRNHDEVRFWQLYLDGAFDPPPAERFILLGDANLDPSRGDGIGSAIADLLVHPRLQDPLPDQATVTWPQTGPMRVDYLLPSTDLTVSGAGILPPQASKGSRHAVVWVDLAP